jgi:uncharacterized protein YycO
MKKSSILVLLLLCFGIVFCGMQFFQKTKFKTLIQKNKTQTSLKNFKTGDIIFQSSDYGQSKAIKLATHSKYSHVGLVLVTDSGDFVLEAVQPVQVIPIEEWIKRDEKQKYCLMRLKDSSVALTSLDKELKNWVTDNVGKNYDLLFEWSNEKLYCSELVWKVYKEVYKIELSTPKELKDFDLTNPYVQQLMKQRYGKNIPYTQKVVAPEDLYKSDKLLIINELI